MKRYGIWFLCMFSLSSFVAVNAQDVFDINDFVESDEGPWSDIANTTLIVPQVPDGSIKIDGSPSSEEYGKFAGVNVSPGSPDGDVGNAWILTFAQFKNWEGADDSSFTFYLAHDTDNLYVGIEAKDDVVISDNDNPQFWKDDAIEIVVDALNDRVRNNTDNSNDRFGGHNYVNYEGRFSRWNDDLEEQISGVWATDEDLDWTYGEEGDIYGTGGEVDGGWNMEVRFSKRQFEDPDVGNKLVEGYKMGFNIGMDDDDEQGDLEIQYWWANRAHPHEYDQFAHEDGETLEDYPEDEFDWLIDAGGRLSHGGTGEIIFGGPSLTPKEQLATITDPEERLEFVHNTLNTWMGDANCDGEFNSGDLVQVFQEGLFETDQPATWAQGDFDGNGTFDSGDFVVAFQDGGYELGPRVGQGGVNSVPETSGMVLLSLAMLGLARIRRR